MDAIPDSKHRDASGTKQLRETLGRTEFTGGDYESISKHAGISKEAGVAAGIVIRAVLDGE
jgi:hypothetical protein